LQQAPMRTRPIYALDPRESRTQKALLKLFFAFGIEVHLMTPGVAPPSSLFVLVPWDFAALSRGPSSGGITELLMATAQTARLHVPVRNRFLTYCNGPVLTPAGCRAAAMLGLVVTRLLPELLQACCQFADPLEQWEVDAFAKPALAVELTYILHELRKGRELERGRQALRRAVGSGWSGVGTSQIDSISARELESTLRRLLMELGASQERRR